MPTLVRPPSRPFALPPAIGPYPVVPPASGARPTQCGIMDATMSALILHRSFERAASSSAGHVLDGVRCQAASRPRDRLTLPRGVTRHSATGRSQHNGLSTVGACKLVKYTYCCASHWNQVSVAGESRVSQTVYVELAFSSVSLIDALPTSGVPDLFINGFDTGQPSDVFTAPFALTAAGGTCWIFSGKHCRCWSDVYPAQHLGD